MIKRKIKIILCCILGILFLFTNCTFNFQDLAESQGLKSNDTGLKLIVINGVEYDGKIDSFTVSAETTRVTVSAIPNNKNAVCSVSKAVSTLNEGESRDFKIIVTAEDGTSKVYSITITRKSAVTDCSIKDCSIKDIKLNDVSIGSFPDGVNERTYEISNLTDTFTLEVIPGSESALVSVSPESSGVSIIPGETKKLIIKVTNGSSSSEYVLNITRAVSISNDAAISTVQINSTMLPSISDSMAYSFDKYTEEVAITVGLSSQGAEYSISPAVPCKLGSAEVKEFLITVTAEDGTTKNNYSLVITNGTIASSDVILKSLSVNGEPVAVEDNMTYELPAGTTKILIEAETNDVLSSYSVSPGLEIEIGAGETKEFVITVTAEDGSKKDYVLNVSCPAASSSGSLLKNIIINDSVNDFIVGITSGVTAYSKTLTGEGDSLNISVTGESFDSDSSVTVEPAGIITLNDGEAKSFTIVVEKNETTETYSLELTYEKILSVTTDYYWTNKSGMRGTNKTISDWSDWTVNEQIAQCSAYDDPRTWNGIQEVPYDVYALYAAYDDTNLYVMVELVNMVDRASFMWHDYAQSDNCYWDNRDLPLGLVINTGKGTLTNSPTLTDGAPIWRSIDFSDASGFDCLLYHSAKWGYNPDNNFIKVGTPGFFKTNSDGKFSYDSAFCLNFEQEGIVVKYTRGCRVSSTIYYESTPTGNRAESGQTGQSLLDSTVYTGVETNERDMSYWYTIPLKTLGVTKDYIQSTGISVRQLTTNGGSLMDCAPWDLSMVDVATEPCSDDPSTSKEKEDIDNITSAQAKIGG